MPNETSYSHNFMAQQQTHQWDVPFGIPKSVGSLHLVFPFIFHYVFLIHAAKPYWCVNFSNKHFPWAVYLDATTSVLKHLHYSRGIGQEQIQYFECRMQAKSGHGSIDYIHSLVAVILSLSLQPHLDKLNVYHAPFWWGFKSCSMQSGNYMTTVEAGSPLIQKSP